LKVLRLIHVRGQVLVAGEGQNKSGLRPILHHRWPTRRGQQPRMEGRITSDDDDPV